MGVREMLQPGSVVRCRGARWIVIDLAGIDAVLAKRVDTAEKDKLSVAELTPDILQPASDRKRQDLAAIAKEAWESANKRLDLIRPLVDKGRHNRTLDDVKRIAEAARRHYVTVYRWLDAYESTGLLSSLLRQERSDKGERKLDAKVEKIIEESLKEFFLKEERPDLADLMEDIQLRCRRKKIDPPHRNTVHRRVAALSPQLVEEKRLGKKAADYRFRPIRGSFPGADFPLAVVQIDHTPADVMLVDDVHRQPLERPSLTLAIDIFSRMVLGFCVSLDPPGALSTGLCLAHAMLPKEAWLADRRVDAKWPCWGKMRMVHADNAKEFRGTMLAWACQEHGITMENRPKGMPHFGGHVERGFRTFLKRMHRLKGTTFSNVEEKLDYDSEGRAIMTLAEFERWFTIYIVKHYHHRFHRGIKTTPYQRWEDGLLGDDERPGVGLPMRIADEDRLRLDFLPYVERTVQESGVVIDYIEYYADSLRKWIHAPDPETLGKARKFIFRRDPRDISIIWFFDPDTSTYAEIPYRNTSRPPVSIWEARAAERKVREKGRQAVNEDSIFEALEEMREIELEAEAKTKAARRKAQRRREHDKASNGRRAKAAGSKMPPDVSPTPRADGVNASMAADGMFEDLSTIKPFNIKAPKLQ